MKSKIILTIVLLILLSLTNFVSAFTISSNFPSGNITVDSTRNDTVWLRPDLRDTQGEWFYWCFEVRGAKSKTLTFMLPSETTKPGVQYLTTKGPALSFDGGDTWKWLNSNSDWKRTFSYTFTTNKPIRFSMSMPYTRTHFLKFIKPYLKSRNIKLDTLAISEDGRVIDRLTIKPINAVPNYKMLITARHHACEMMANYLIEGIVAETLKDDWLRNNVELCIIPFMDIDGVEKGDQGKNRNGHDHNRDYADSSIYASTLALRNFVPLWADHKLAITLDIHCPWIRFNENDRAFTYGASNPKNDLEIREFCKLLKINNSNELKITDNFYVPEAAPSSPGLSSRRWFSAYAEDFGVKLPLTIEFPYATNNGQTVTQQNARAFGVDVAKALKEYITSNERKSEPVDYVDNFIGVRSRGGNCIIGPQLPFGCISPSPQTKRGSDDGYHPAEPIRGFGQLHVSGTGWGTNGQIFVSPQIG
ncbi:MAG: M14 family zinc carboxypeptidase, partial [Paludibacter sp.]